MELEKRVGGMQLGEGQQRINHELMRARRMAEWIFFFFFFFLIRLRGGFCPFYF